MQEGNKRKLDVDEMKEYLSREELLMVITALEENEEAKNIIQSTMKEMGKKRKLDTDENIKPKKKMKIIKKREFDITKFRQRHIALRIAYIGDNLDGFASQENAQNTVEAHLFSALEKVCLIGSRETSNYSRCGRTDKGVSALGQVIGIHVRSNLKRGVEFIDDREGDNEMGKDEKNEKKEIEFDSILNRVLPPYIRVLSWSPVSRNFSARFSCEHRVYRYFFTKYNLDIEKMRLASSYLLGEHDFRNFCKMDVVNCSNFMRCVDSISIERDLSATYQNSLGVQELYYVEIKGTAFLYHQVRCMMAILFLVGDGRESPDVIKKMLDLELFPRKPSYSFASEIPLVLYDCIYKEGEFNWRKTSFNEERVYKDFNNMWEQNAINSAKASLFASAVTPLELNCSYDECRKFKKHSSLATRPTCTTFEERVESLNPRRKARMDKKATFSKDEGESRGKEGEEIVAGVEEEGGEEDE